MGECKRMTLTPRLLDESGEAISEMVRDAAEDGFPDPALADLARLRVSLARMLARVDEAMATVASFDPDGERAAEEREAAFERSQDPETYRGPDGVIGNDFKE